jgi:hypothetical protein
MSSKRVNFADLYDLDLSKKTKPIAEIAIATTTIESSAIENSAIAEITTETVAIAEEQNLLWQNVISGERWTGIPNDLIDHVLRTLKPSDQAVLLQLYRLTWGYKTTRIKISHDKLGKRSGISKRQAQTCTLRLEAKHLIKRIDTGKTESAEYEMLLPPATRTMAKSAIAKPATNKEIKEKEIEKKDCSKCNGTGFWYPEGVEKGVQRCKHT